MDEDFYFFDELNCNCACDFEAECDEDYYLNPVTCTCDCVVIPDDECGEGRRFDVDECACVCDEELCLGNFEYSWETCRCECNIICADI